MQQHSLTTRRDVKNRLLTFEFMTCCTSNQNGRINGFSDQL